MRKPMMNSFSVKSFLLLVLFFFSFLFRASALSAADFLDPEDAFILRAELGSNRTVVLHWDIAKGYKLYRDMVKVSVEQGNAEISDPVLPAGVTVTDPTTNETVAIYHDALTVELPLVRADGVFTLKAEYQGCAEDGLCYPPVTRLFTVNPGQPGILKGAGGTSGLMGESDAPVSDSLSVTATPLQNAAPVDSEVSLAKATLEGGSFWKISLIFLLFGLLLSFTPCILPMIPILSSIIVGEGEVTRARGFLLALAYCLGMALVYTSLGVVAGLAGEGLAGALQKPWVLVVFAILLVLLSLSMFDLYQLQLPSALQNRLARVSGGLKGGRFAGVFVMGALSALIVGPCVAAPLAGTLVYISQTRNVLIGGFALFSMAVGMSIPLLIVGLSAGSLLPRVGAWMIGVKYVFGLLLIAVAIWMVSPVLLPSLVLLAWGAFAILCSVFLGVFDALPEKPAVGRRFSKALGLFLFVVGVVELVGAASGATNPLEPLSKIRSTSVAGSGEERAISFTRIRSVAELDQALQNTQSPVMLDFYADWCVSCKEMERHTFHDPKVLRQLKRLTLLQVDVTRNTEDDRALMKRFELYGPPGIMFFDASGREIPGSRVIGFVDAARFATHIDTCLPGLQQ
ncbi:MAG: protein-disulfide reductase DsbD [Chlorobium sp.]|jgi:thiol:disulfide interchange protein DsbD|nr:protein-disulfide reductase DsbD [Chlorobium sp.]